jgi:gliding motility-associated-like protein
MQNILYRSVALILCCWIISFGSLSAQLANVNYTVQVDRVIGNENPTSGACWETGDEEYSAYVFARDNVNGTETSSGCLTCDANGNCTYGVGVGLHTRNNTAAYTVTGRLDAWEDDRGGRCSYDGSCFVCNADDCRRQETLSYDFREQSVPSNGTFTSGPLWGSTANHQWQLRVTWNYVGTANLLTPTCAPQSAAYSGGAIRSWSLNLTGGVTYNFTTCGTATNDTYIRVYDADGYTLVAQNDDACGLQSNLNFTPGSTGTYYLELANFSRNQLSAGGSLTYSIAAPTTSTNGGNLSGCPGQASAGLGGASPAVGVGTWTSSSPTVTFNNINTPNTTVVGTTPGTYTLTWTINNGGCTSSSSLTYTVSSNSAAPTAITGSSNICQGDNTTLTVSGGSAGTGAVATWYSGSCGGTPEGTGNSITVSPASTTTYYVRYEGDCNNTTCAALTVNVLPASVASSTNTDVCPGNSATLLATGAGAISFNWYAVPTGGTPLQSGSSVFTTPPITTATTYYVSAINAGGCEGPRAPVTVGVLSAPAPTTAGTTTICNGETTTLTATAAGATDFNWYQNSDKTGFLQNGASLTTLPLNFTTTFYVAATYANGCESLLTPVTVTVNQLPPAPVANGGNYCENEDVIVTAFGTGGTINWYDAATGGTLLSTGSTYNAGTQAAGNYVYYVEEDDGSCQSLRTAVLAVVNPAPAAPAVNSPTICEGEQATLIATPTTGTIEWYADAAMTNLLATGSSYTTTILSTTTDYYVVEVSNVGCRSMASTATVTVNPAAATPTVSGATICANSTTTLTATNSGGTTNWYADAATTILVGTGTSFSTPALVQNTTYYIQETSAAGCNSAIATATVIVNPLPAMPSTSPLIVCEGEDAILSATGSGTGDLVFYDNTQTEIGRTTMSVAVPNASLNLGTLTAGNYVYYVGEDDGSCVSILATIGVTVNTTPAAPTATGATICAGESANLNATGTGIQWYADAGLTTILAVGNNFNPGALTATTDYYVTQTTANGCQSTATMVSVTVNPNPVDPTVTGATICAGASASLTATSSGGTINWYADPSATSLITTGTTYNTPNLQQTTTYFVQEEDANGCTSAVMPVTVTVNPLPNAPSASNPVVCEGDDVILTATGSGSGDLVFYDNTLTEIGRTTMSVAVPNASLNLGALTAGNYVYYVGEDDGTCVSLVTTISATVNSLPAAPTATGSTICSGSSAVLTATGSGIAWYADAALTNLIMMGNVLNTGTLTTTTDYYVTQTNANGCESAATTVTATVNPNPANPVGTGATICAGSSAALTATGGTGVLTWYIDAGATQLAAVGATYNTPILQQTTTYYVQEVDANGCASGIVAVTAIVNPLPNTPAASNPIVCEGDDVILSASGSGSGDLVFYDAAMVEISRTTMSMANPNASFNAGALTAGSYTYFVREDNGSCLSSIVTIGVTVNPTPAAPLTTTDTVCSGSIATLTATGSGTIGWYADAALTSQLGLGNVFTTTALTANTSYWAASTDVNGCISLAAQVDVVVNPAPAAPTAANDTVCAGNAASLTASGAGGTLNWYSDAAGMNQIATGATLNIPTISQSTTYYVAETDANGCMSMTAAVQVVVNPAPTAPAAPAVDACEGDVVVLSATGSGTGDIVFYDNTGTEIGRGTMGAGNSTITFSVGTLTAGTYSYFAAEEQGTGCSSAQVAINVNVQAAPAAPTAFNDSPVCEGEDVFLQATTVSGGIYNWTGPNGFSSTNQDNMLNAVTAADAGTYSVSVFVNGCESPIATTDVIVNANPVIASVSNNGPLCEGENLIISTPTQNGVDYNWTGPNGFSSNQAQFIVPSVTEVDDQGFYTLTIEDQSNGCISDPVSTLVIVNKLPDPGMAFSNSPLCVGEDLQLSVPEVFGASYSWTGPNGFTSIDRTPVITNVNALAAGTYNVEVTIDSCTTLLEVEVTIDTIPNTSVIPDTTILQGDEIVLYATGGITYQWGPADYLNGTATPTPVFGGAPVGEYVYSVDITSANGCTAQEKVTVTVETRTDIIITDLFTPNGDGVNDTWVIEFLENVEPYTLQVFSRGGLEVYRSENYMSNWDGTQMNSGKNLPDGTYYYLIRTQFREYTGAVTIKR